MKQNPSYNRERKNGRTVFGAIVKVGQVAYDVSDLVREEENVSVLSKPSNHPPSVKSASEMESTISIRNTQGQIIVGILHKVPLTAQVSVGKPKIGLICHGIFGHKNYLYQPLLAKSLPFDTFRFDFRGNGDSDGQMKYADFDENVDDLVTVVKYLEKEYEIYTIIGHSRGAIVMFRYAATHGRSIPHIVNISARFYMINVKSRHDERILETQGYYDWKARANGKDVSLKISKEDLELFANWDNYFVKELPLTMSVLTCHGLEDKIVPVRDAAAYANIIPIHTLQLFPGADHNYQGHYEELVSVVSRYFDIESAKEVFWRHGAGMSVQVPRWIQVEGVRNFRDLGGWSLRSGSNGTAYFRERMIFRCGDITNITDEGIMTLYQLNIRAIFDFRSIPEIEKSGGPRAITGITRIAVPIFSEVDYSPEALAFRWENYFGGADGFAKVYQTILSNAPPHFSVIFRHMLRNPQSPLLIHCTAGKDRTGVFCMLTLGLCGVDDEVICREYELTERGYWVEDQQIQAYSQALNKTPEEIQRFMSSKFVRIFIAVCIPNLRRYEAMKATLTLFRATYGSFEEYVRDQCGLSEQEVIGLRRMLVVEAGATVGGLRRPRL
ncbi:protein-tyrosine phosphatase-like protein [Endogone sp. FLAS-F59071]|nr:protein-tyrosine phosphatase-like protein [Endogone sp. FLAS-F59071]|eukprot:RUS15872.1 protein-tyrosine phosphatase-like protein [Endogone sp. FLAS-F59071]